MANSKLSDLGAVTTVADTDQVYLITGGASRSSTVRLLSEGLDSDIIPFVSPTGSIAAGSVGDAIREIEDDLGNYLLNTTDVFTGTLDVVGTAGIGIARTDGTLHVHTATAGAVAPGAAADDLVVEGAINPGISILSPDNQFTSLQFGSPNANTGCYFDWKYNNAQIRIGTNIAAGNISIQTAVGAEAIRIDNTQQVGVGTANPISLLDVSQTTDGTTLSISSLQNDSGHSTSTPYGKLEFYSGDASGGGAGARAEIGCYPNGTAGSSGHLVFKTSSAAAAAENMRLTHDGKLGIGDFSSTIPDGTLHVHTATAGSISATSTADDLVVENSAAGGISILVPDASNSNFYFGSPTDPIGAQLSFNYNAAKMRIGTHLTGGELAFESAGGVEAMRIDSSQNVAVGIATGGDGTFHVHTATAGSVTADSTADDLTVENSGDGGISILTPDASTGSLIFASPADNIGARLAYNQSSALFQVGTHVTSGELRFNSGVGTQAMYIDSNQDVVIGSITAPDGTLHVHTVSAGAVTASTSGDDLIVEGTSVGMSLLTGDSSISSILFGTPTNNAGARFTWDYTNNLFNISSNKVGAEIRLRSGNASEAMILDSNQDIGVGLVASLDGKLHIDQASTSGAKPVLTLDQGDVSEEFIKLIGTSSTGAGASQSFVDAANATTPGTLTGWFKIEVQDDQGTGPIAAGAYYVPFYTEPTA